MSLNFELVDDFAKHLEAQGKQLATVESYSRDAKHFLTFLQENGISLEKIDPSVLIAFQNDLRDRLHERENSIRRKIISVRQFFRYISAVNNIDESPFDLVPIPPRQEELPPDLTTTDVENVIRAANQHRPEFRAKRDTTVIALLAYEGLKAHEVIELKWEDCFVTEASTTLHISGDRSRVITLLPETNRALLDYVAIYKEAEGKLFPKNFSNSVFISFKGKDSALPSPKMSRHGLKFLLYEMGQETGIDHLNTERLRHYAMSRLLASGCEPEQIMNHLGLRRLGNIAKHMVHVRNQSQSQTQGASVVQ